MRFLVTFFLVSVLLIPISRAAGESTTDYMGVDDARKLQLAGSPVVFIDVRSEQEWREVRITGARSIPVDVIGQRSNELPKTGLIVLY